VIETAARFKRIVFPVFTNGTMISEGYLTLFDKNRNVIPVISIEGSSNDTDKRRGEGVSEKIDEATRLLHGRDILFGVSVTVTSRNWEEVTDAEFLKSLRSRGCGLVFFVEYVPAESGTEELVLSTRVQ
jgi:MoaA/NifB/PqqE/SkfB family radical SAM enzyme